MLKNTISITLTIFYICLYIGKKIENFKKRHKVKLVILNVIGGGPYINDHGIQNTIEIPKRKVGIKKLFLS